jgi:hypothetical protein
MALSATRLQKKVITSIKLSSFMAVFGFKKWPTKISAQMYEAHKTSSQGH